MLGEHGGRNTEGEHSAPAGAPLWSGMQTDRGPSRSLKPVESTMASPSFQWFLETLNILHLHCILSVVALPCDSVSPAFSLSRRMPAILD